MDTKQLAVMLSDPACGSLKKMAHKYSPDDISAMLDFMKQNMIQPLPLSDFSGNAVVWQPSTLPSMNFTGIKKLLENNQTAAPFGAKAMEEEIYSTFEIESINTSRDSIRRILNGYAPQSKDESRIHGMKLGLEYIADFSHTINEDNLHTLYQMAIGSYLAADDKLQAGSLYRHDAVYISDGTKTVHQGASAKDLQPAMCQLLNLANQTSSNEPSTAAVLHFQLAYLHPYFDGNGRMARLLHLWYLVQKGYSSALFLPFSKYVNGSRSAYYKAFTLIEENQQISHLLDITPFVAYCIEHIYNLLQQEGPAEQTSHIFEQSLAAGNITEKEKDLWSFVLSHYGTEPFSTKQLEMDSRMAAYATIRSFVIKFAALGLLQVQTYGNRNKYSVK